MGNKNPRLEISPIREPSFLRFRRDRRFVARLLTAVGRCCRRYAPGTSLPLNLSLIHPLSFLSDQVVIYSSSLNPSPTSPLRRSQSSCQIQQGPSSLREASTAAAAEAHATTAFGYIPDLAGLLQQRAVACPAASRQLPGSVVNRSRSS